MALTFLSDVPTLPILPGIFHLTLLTNTGVAFGLFKGYGLAVTFGTVALLLAVVLSTLRRGGWAGNRTVRLGLGLVAGGALGNLLDRFRLGGVVDFLDFRVWPVFNLADSCITVGAALMAWAIWRHRECTRSSSNPAA